LNAFFLDDRMMEPTLAGNLVKYETGEFVARNHLSTMPPALTQESLRLLSNAFEVAWESTHKETQDALALLATADATGTFPQGVPEWMQSAFMEALMPDNGSTTSAREALSVAQERW
jgi:hypothetical protein